LVDGPRASLPSTQERELSRVEAFSDGVVAIAITLLVLTLTVPTLSHRTLRAALIRTANLQEYLAYAVSFLTIGVMWVNHHRLFGLLERVDRQMVFLNLLLLMAVVLMPYATLLVARYLTNGLSGSEAVAVVGGVGLFVSIGFALMWLRALSVDGLVDPDVDRATLHKRTEWFLVGLVVCVVCIGLAFVSATGAFILIGPGTVYYGLDQIRAWTGAVARRGAAPLPAFSHPWRDTRQGARQAIGKPHDWRPPQERARQRDIGLTDHRVIDGE
jgi:uncharacterized membrane protein